GPERRIDLREVLALDLERQRRPGGPGRPHRRADVAAAERQVVVLDQDRVVERQAVVRAAPRPDGVLGEEAEAGERLPRVTDDELRAPHAVDAGPRQRRDPAEVLEEVEREPLPREKDPGVALERRESLTRDGGGAFGGVERHADGAKGAEHPVEEREPADDEPLLRRAPPPG